MKAPLWRCPKCRRRFANRKQSHTCAKLDLAHHFVAKPPLIRALYDEVLKRVRKCGPVFVLPEETRIAFQVRMSFAQVTPRRQWLDGHVVLAGGSSIRASAASRRSRRAITCTTFGSAR